MPTIDLPTLLAYKAKRLLRVQSHPTLPLQIWNYSQLVQAKGPWDEITTLCRGLITEGSEIIARAFPKFWNDNQRPPADEPHTVHEKLDGSLGILFHYRDQWIISSRGSFVSDQSIRATELLSRYDLTPLDPTLSYILEIIYPENRIVVDYEDTEALYFLAAFRTTGEEVTDPTLHHAADVFPLCPTYPEYATTPLADLKALDLSNREGFVLRYATHRVKVKFPSYLALHQTATVSSSFLFDAFGQQQSFESVLESIPDEFHAWATEQWNATQQAYDTLLTSLKDHLASLAPLSPREFAAAIAAHPNKAVLFLLRSQRDPFAAVFRCLMPPKEESKWRTTTKPVATLPKLPKLAAAPFQQTITLLIGISGSGKSTYAKKSHLRTVVVSRDQIREAFRTPRYYESPLLAEYEAFVTETEHAQIAAAHAARFHVIVDDTNLTPRIIKGFMQRHTSARFEYHLFDVPLSVAMERVAQRVNPIPLHRLHAQHAKLLALLPVLPQLFATTPLSPISLNPELPHAVIVDLDGTLAQMSDRNAYDPTRVEEDTMDPTVYEVMCALPYQKVLCSGRSEEAREGTERWLRRHGVPYVELHLRPKGDMRPDTVVKEEMWRALATRYHLKFLLDDRNTVVAHGRRLGLKVWQVQEGAF